MPASSVSACWMRPAPARSSPPQRPTRWSAADGGGGHRRRLLLIVKNYEGDVMNFEMAARDAGRRPESDGA